MTRRKDINAVRNNPQGYQQAWIDGLKDRAVRYEAQAIEEAYQYHHKKLMQSGKP